MSREELEALRQAAADDPGVPDVVRSMLKGGAHLDELRLTALGRWQFNGAPVEHPRVQALFSRCLVRTDAGTWVLAVPPYTYPVLVDGAPRFVHRLRGATPEGQLGTQAWRALDLATLETDGDDYLGVRIDGAPARLVDAAYQALLDHVDRDAAGWFVTWDGIRYPIRSNAPDREP